MKKIIFLITTIILISPKSVQAQVPTCAFNNTLGAGNSQTITSSCYISQTIDGIDDASSTTSTTSNNAILNLESGDITINSDKTLVVGQIKLDTGSIAIADNAKIIIGSPLWLKDADEDLFPDLSIGATYSSSQPNGYYRKNSIISNGQDANDTVSCPFGINPSGTCNKCVNGDIANQTSNEDLFSECSPSSESCSANKCSVNIASSGNCSGSGACDGGSPVNVTNGKVCLSAGTTTAEISPNLTTNAGIGYSCPSGHCNGIIYYRACDGSGNPRADNVGAGSSAVNVGTSKYISSVCAATNGNCTTGTNCGTYYRDADNDAYGDPATTAKSCVSAPSGWVANNTDANPAVSCADGANPAGTCNKCSSGAIAYQTTSEDLFGECAASYNACSANKCDRTGPSGNCNNAGACNTTGGSIYVINGKVCKAAGTTAVDITPNIGTSAGTGYSCTADSCSGTIYYRACNGAGAARTDNTGAGSSTVTIGTGLTKHITSACIVTNGSCTTGTGCNSYYRDADIDGYGVTTATKVCYSAPSGYVATSGDCCDVAGVGKSFHPGVTTWYGKGTNCTGVGNTWDYNCSGTAERENSYGYYIPSSSYCHYTYGNCLGGSLGYRCSTAENSPCGRTGYNYKCAGQCTLRTDAASYCSYTSGSCQTGSCTPSTADFYVCGTTGVATTINCH